MHSFKNYNKMSTYRFTTEMNKESEYYQYFFEGLYASS